MKIDNMKCFCLPLLVCFVMPALGGEQCTTLASNTSDLISCPIVTTQVSSIQSLVKVSEELSRKTCPYTDVYLGIAGSGEGAGRLGHGFLVFTSRKGDFNSGDVYQFNMAMPPDAPDPLAAYNQGRHILTKEKALSFIKRYTNEDRVVLLYRAKISVDDVKDIYQIIDSEFNKRKYGEFYDYSVLTKNCLTQVVDVLNAVMKDRGIKTIWQGGAWQVSLPGLSSIAANLPLVLATDLENHTSFEKPIMFEPVSNQETRIGLSFQKSFETLQKVCKWEEDKAKVIHKMLRKKDVRRTKAFLGYLQQEVKSCNNTEAVDAFNDIINIISNTDPNAAASDVLSFQIE